MTGIVKYEDSMGNAVELAPSTIRQYLVSGSGKVTDQEIMMYTKLCQAQKLNPWLRECYLIKYGDKSPATLVVGKEAYTKRAFRHADYDGYDAEESFDWGEREPTVKGAPHSARVRVYRKGLTRPAADVTVYFDEYVGRKFDGSITSMWKGKPATMLRKVALVQALREAFPEEYAGLYEETELNAGELRGEAELPREAIDVTPSHEDRGASEKGEGIVDVETEDEPEMLPFVDKNGGSSKTEEESTSSEKGDSKPKASSKPNEHGEKVRKLLDIVSQRWGASAKPMLVNKYGDVGNWDDDTCKEIGDALRNLKSEEEVANFIAPAERKVTKADLITNAQSLLGQVKTIGGEEALEQFSPPNSDSAWNRHTVEELEELIRLCTLYIIDAGPDKEW